MIFVSIGICFLILFNGFHGANVVSDNRPDIADPLFAFINSRIEDLKPLFQGMKSNDDALPLIIAVDDRIPQNGCIQGLDPLLTVYQYFLSF
jgi:hypothetical protein